MLRSGPIYANKPHLCTFGLEFVMRASLDRIRFLRSPVNSTTVTECPLCAALHDQQPLKASDLKYTRSVLILLGPCCLRRCSSLQVSYASFGLLSLLPTHCQLLDSLCRFPDDVRPCALLRIGLPGPRTSVKCSE